jgi:hypothetical protein
MHEILRDPRIGRTGDAGSAAQKPVTRYNLRNTSTSYLKSNIPRGCPTKTTFTRLLLSALAVIAIMACGGGDDSSGDSALTSGTDQEQVETLIRTFSERTTALDADGSFELLCQSLLDKSDVKQIRQNMEGFKNIGNQAPQVSNLTFTSVTTNGNEGEARYNYRQVFRGETTTIQEAVKVAKEKGKWCIKDQLFV